MSLQELDFNALSDAVYLTNPKINQSLIKNKDLILKSFSGSDNGFVYKFYKLITDREEPINKSDFKLFLDISGVYENMQVNYLEKFDLAQELSDNSTQEIFKQLENEIHRNILKELNNDTITPSEYIKAIKEIDFSLELTEEENKYIEYESLSSLKAEDFSKSYGKPLKSAFDFINQAFPINGYIREQLIAIAAAPANGKSQIAIDEMIEQLRNGEKVFYCAIGDLNRADFMSRMIAKWFNFSIDYAFMYIEKYWPILQEEVTKAGGKMGIAFIVPNIVHVGNLLQDLEDKGYLDEFDNFFFDYDNNLASDNEMYDKGNEIYQALSALSRRKGKTVFVLSQLKTSAWSKDLIEEEDLGESRRKGEIADFILTISRRHNSKNKVGYLNIAKARRAKDSFCPYFMDISGKFYQIDENTFRMLSSSNVLYSVTEQGANLTGYEYNKLRIKSHKTNNTIEAESEARDIDSIESFKAEQEQLFLEEFNKESQMFTAEEDTIPDFDCDSDEFQDFDLEQETEIEQPIVEEEEQNSVTEEKPMVDW